MRRDDDGGVAMDTGIEFTKADTFDNFMSQVVK